MISGHSAQGKCYGLIDELKEIVFEDSFSYDHDVNGNEKKLNIRNDLFVVSEAHDLEACNLHNLQLFSLEQSWGF